MVFCNLLHLNKLDMLTRHNPYFSRWFSAIDVFKMNLAEFKGHNPYFSRWFSAINNIVYDKKVKIKVTILILVDGFLQY